VLHRYVPIPNDRPPKLAKVKALGKIKNLASVESAHAGELGDDIGQSLNRLVFINGKFHAHQYTHIAEFFNDSRCAPYQVTAFQSKTAADLSTVPPPFGC
jgi:hypothetical protein